MKCRKKVVLLLGSVMFVCLLTPLLVQARSSDWVYHRFTDVPAWGKTQTVITASTRSVKVTNSAVGSLEGSTGSVLRPMAQLVNSNGDERCVNTTLTTNFEVYYPRLLNAKVNYYYYPRVRSHNMEFNTTSIELWYSSDELR